MKKLSEKKTKLMVLGLLLGGSQSIALAQQGEVAVATAARGGDGSIGAVIVHGQPIVDSELSTLRV